MRPINARRQRGAALLVILTVVMLGASWFLVSKLNAESGMAQAVYKAHNAEVMNRAKLALISYVAAQALKAGENNPGALPCPEAAGNYGDPNYEGTVASSCTLPKVGRFPWRTLGTDKLVDAAGEPLWYVVSPGWARVSGNTNINSNSVGQLTVDGTATTPVASPGTVSLSAHGFVADDSVTFTTGGTLPTGITAGTPYYVISSGLTTNAFRISATVGGSAINFTGTTSGTHNAHRNPPGAANSVVALIIAPGPAIVVASASGCTAFSQSRPTTGTPDLRNYLECENATYPTPDGFFATTGPSGSFNDQVLKITVADVMPGIEAAIASRIEREILPALKTVYTPATWGFTGSNPILPFASPFASPGPGTGTSSYQGAAATYTGLLPFNDAQGCTESATDRRCTTVTSGTSGTTGLPAFLVFSKPTSYVDTRVAGSGSVRTISLPNTSTCAWQSSVYVCTGEYTAPSISVSVSVNVTNIAMGLRTFDSSKVTCTAVDDAGGGIGVQSVTCSSSVVLQSDGSAKLTVVTAALPDVAGSGWGTYANYKINIDRAAFADHALLDSTDGTTGWFVRNEWYRLLYYGVAASNTAARLAASAPAERSCSLVGDCLSLTTISAASNQSALLVLAGRSINGRARPSATLADYFEFGNTKGTFERQTVAAPAASMYADTGSANAYVVAATSVATGATFQFRATNANTNNSTLTTTATGLKNLVNLDGTNLAAATIQANAAVQVTWDGTKFLLSKRPFNDRVVAIGSN